jgi:integrase
VIHSALLFRSFSFTWESVREAADVKERFHDLRHLAYTKMVEAGVPEGVIMALMGHVSGATAERYSHVRMDAMRQAVESLSLTKATVGTPILLAKETAKVNVSAAVQ